MATLSTTDRRNEPSLLRQIVSQPKPWDAAYQLRLVRHDYRPDEVIDAGVNFLVMALGCLGATTAFSCEGHPAGFYITFEAPYGLAVEIQQAGIFRVEVAGAMGRWTIRLCRQAETSEKLKRRALRWAAEAWVKHLLLKRILLSQDSELVSSLG